MKVRDIAEILEADILVEAGNLDVEIYEACGSDLMSDVMAYVKENAILLTGLVNLQTVRTAEMMDIKVILFVRGKTPNEQMIALAQEKGIAILATRHTMFYSCGKLYSAGISGRCENH